MVQGFFFCFSKTFVLLIGWWLTLWYGSIYLSYFNYKSCYIYNSYFIVICYPSQLTRFLLINFRSEEVDLLSAHSNITFNEDSTGPLSKRNEYYIYVYSSILAVFIFTSYAATGLMAIHANLASKSLHNRALTSIVGAPMSFFNSKPTGKFCKTFIN